MYELQEIIITSLDLSNYIPKQELYIEYENQLNKALELYKQNNKLEPITEDIIDEQGDVILSIEMQEINRDYEIKQQLKQNVKIEITDDNLLIYFTEKPKSEIEILEEKVQEYDNIIQDLLFNIIPSITNNSTDNSNN